MNVFKRFFNWLFKKKPVRPAQTTYREVNRTEKHFYRNGFVYVMQKNKTCVFKCNLLNRAKAIAAKYNIEHNALWKNKDGIIFNF